MLGWAAANGLLTLRMAWAKSRNSTAEIDFANGSAHYEWALGHGEWALWLLRMDLWLLQACCGRPVENEVEF